MLLPAFENMSTDLVSRLGPFVDNTPPVLGNFIECANFNVAAVDNDLLCGRDITVTNLPSGFRVILDSDPPIVEVGGQVVIDMTTKFLPRSQIDVDDGVDVVATFVATDDIWGGDTYAFQGDTGGATNIPGPSQLPDHIAPLARNRHIRFGGLGY